MSVYLVAVSISLINFEYVPCKGPVFDIRSNALMGWGRWSWAWVGVVWDVLMGGCF